MKLHSVLYEKYLLHIVFSFPFTLVNERFSMFVLLVPSLTSLVWKVGVKLIPFCKNINFGSSNTFSCKLYLGQAVLSRLHTGCWLSHILSFGFSQFQGPLDDKEGHVSLLSASV